MLQSAAPPPVEGLSVVHEAGGELDIVEIAELPQLFCRARVLEEDPVDVEGIEVPGSEVLQGIADAGEQLPQLFFVVGGDGLASCLTF